MNTKYNLNVGGVIAMGIDQSSRYLITVSHSGRGIFELCNGKKLHRDSNITYPVNNKIEGIGLCENKIFEVVEKDYKSDKPIVVVSTDKNFKAEYHEGCIEITRNQ